MRRSVGTILLALICFAVAFAVTAGPTSPINGTSDASIGDVAWTRPDRALTSNNLYATCGLGFSPSQSSEILLLQFEFGTGTIPATATIDGLVIEVEQKASVASTGSVTYCFVDFDGVYPPDGTTGGGGEISTTEAYVTFGGATSTWGQTMTPAGLNSGFWFYYGASNIGSSAVTVSVDHAQATAYYTEAAGVKKKLIGHAGTVRLTDTIHQRQDE